MGCNIEGVISVLPDEVLARIFAFLSCRRVLSLRLLSKAVNERLDRRAFIWILSATRMGLANFLQAAASVAQCVAPERLDVLALAFLTQWYRKERVWRRQDYERDTLYMLKDKANVYPYRSRTIETKFCSSHIDQLGSRSISAAQLLATGNSEHLWRVCRAVLPCASTQKDLLEAFLSPVFVEESQPDLGSVRSFFLFWLHHHATSSTEKPADDDVSPASSVSGGTVKSKVVFCRRMVVPRTIMKSLPPAVSISLPPRENGAERTARGSTWAGYVDLRPRAMTSMLGNSPPFLPSVIVNWDPVLMEAPSGTTISSKGMVKARISAHLVRRNELVETLGPPVVVFSWEMAMNDRVVALSSVALVEQLEGAVSCRWLVGAGTIDGRVLFSVSEGTNGCALLPNSSSSSSSYVSTSHQFTCRVLDLVRLPVAQICLSFHEFGEQDGEDQAGRSLSILCQFETGTVCIYRTPLPRTRDGGGESIMKDWLCLPWCCMARLQDRQDNIGFVGWSPPMDQLVVGGMDSSEEAKYLLVVVPRVPNRDHKTETIELGAGQVVLRVEKRADCEEVECTGEEGDSPRSVSFSSPEARHHVARLRLSNISEAHAMSFLRCWVFVTEKCLRVIEVVREKGKKKKQGAMRPMVKAVLSGHRGTIQACATDGFHKFASACSAGDIMVWDIARCVRLTRLKVLDPHGLPPSPSRAHEQWQTETSKQIEEELSRPQAQSARTLLNSPEFPALGLHTPPPVKKSQTSYAEKSREKLLILGGEQLMASPEDEQLMASPADEQLLASPADEQLMASPTEDEISAGWHCRENSLGMDLRDFSRCYEAQLMFDVQPHQQDPSSSSSLSFEDQQERWAAMEGWSLPCWLSEQRARFYRLARGQMANSTPHPRKMVSLITRSIFSNSFEHDFELPMEHEGETIVIDLPRDLKRAIAENKKRQRSENFPLISYQPQVSQLFLYEEHIGVFFTSCRTWQVWSFMNGSENEEKKLSLLL